MKISPADLDALTHAKQLLEHPGFAAKLVNLLGAPLEKGFKLLPSGWTEKVQSATTTALQRALEVAVATLDDQTGRASSDFLHKLVVAAIGAAGGAVGLAALPIELPISTTVMLRSIADIARAEGERIRDPAVKLACLEVFALGGAGRADDAVDTSYFFVRAALAREVSEAAAYLAEKGIVQEGAPAIVRLIAQIGSRFGVLVSEKIAAEAVPLIGAVGGALVNTVFSNHFQNMARGHFIVRRLERAYGAAAVKLSYENL
jgi:hypothetical protein